MNDATDRARALCGVVNDVGLEGGVEMLIVAVWDMLKGQVPEDQMPQAAAQLLGEAACTAATVCLYGMTVTKAALVADAFLQGVSDNLNAMALAAINKGLIK